PEERQVLGAPDGQGDVGHLPEDAPDHRRPAEVGRARPAHQHFVAGLRGAVEQRRDERRGVLQREEELRLRAGEEIGIGRDPRRRGRVEPVRADRVDREAEQAFVAEDEAIQGPVLAHRIEDHLAHLRPGRGAAQRLGDLGQKLAVEPWRGHGDAGGRERAAVLQERADEAILVRPVDPEMIGDLHRSPAVFRGDPIRPRWTGEPPSSNPGAMIADQKRQPPDRPARAAGGGGEFWSAGALLIAAFVVMPVTAVLVLAFHPTENIWPHLLATTLPRYAANTAILTLGTGA